MGSERLAGGSRVVVIGGGPAGCLFTIQLMRFLKSAGRQLPRVWLFDSKPSFDQYGVAGCNLCAGVLASTLIERLRGIGVPLGPVPRLMQRVIHGYVLDTDYGRFRLSNPFPERRILTVNRNRGPSPQIAEMGRSFDRHLLDCAMQAGPVEHIAATVERLEFSAGGGPVRVWVRGDEKPWLADLVLGAFGVNSSMIGSLERAGIGFRRPGMLNAQQMEVAIPREEVYRRFRNCIHILTAPRLKHLKLVAVTPKRNHVTVTAIGSVANQNLDADTMKQILALLQERRILSPDQKPMVACRCQPAFPIAPAHNPVYHRLILIGDASGYTRYLKNGIESAFNTATAAARAALGYLDQDSLRTSYLPAVAWIQRDNRYGVLVEKFHHFIQTQPLMQKGYLSLLMHERRQPEARRAASHLMWSLLSGEKPYRDIFRGWCRPAIQSALVKHTLRAGLHFQPPRDP